MILKIIKKIILFIKKDCPVSVNKRWGRSKKGGRKTYYILSNKTTKSLLFPILTVVCSLSFNFNFTGEKSKLDVDEQLAYEMTLDGLNITGFC